MLVLRWMRVPTAARDVTALQRRASARPPCNRGCGDFAASYDAAGCVGASGAREWLRWMREGLFRGRQEVQVLFTGTKQESSLEKHTSGKSKFL